jgi:hypothetical protein
VALNRGSRPETASPVFRRLEVDLRALKSCVGVMDAVIANLHFETQLDHGADVISID